MKIHKLDMEHTRKLLQERHTLGNLVKEIPALTVAAEDTPSPKARANVEKVLRLALEVAGLERPNLDPESIPQQQVRVYVLCEGGFLGAFAACQPADFYVDDRCGFSGRAKRKIYREVERLKLMAEKAKLNPHDMPSYPAFHNCGVF